MTEAIQALFIFSLCVSRITCPSCFSRNCRCEENAFRGKFRGIESILIAVEETFRTKLLNIPKACLLNKWISL